MKEPFKTAESSSAKSSIPKFKGTTKIEIFENGNKVSESVDQNMMTNFVQETFNPPRFYLGETSDIDFFKNLTPIYDKLLGGILLYSQPVEENEENTIIGIDENTCVGHAGGAYSGADHLRGAYNANESGFIDTQNKWKGYRHVWDFATDKANGLISCACLTSKIGGDIGYGAGVEQESSSTRFALQPLLSNINIIGSDVPNISFDTFRFIGVSEKKCKFAFLVGTTALYLIEFPCENLNFGIAEAFDGKKVYLDASESENETTKVTKVNLPFDAGNNKSVFVDGGKYFIVRHKTETSFDFTSFDPISKTFSTIQDRVVSPAYYRSNNKSVIIGNYWFAPASDTVNKLENMVRYPISGGQGEVFPVKTRDFPSFVSSNRSDLVIIARKASSAGKETVTVVGSEDTSKNMEFYTTESEIGDVTQIIGDWHYAFRLVAATTGKTIEMRSAKIGGCMASINNLRVPITKTEAQTMKITYEITAEEE